MIVFNSFFDNVDWYDHIEAHLAEKEYLKRPFCDHPACNIEFPSIDELRHHLKDTHCWRPPRGHKAKTERSPVRGRKRKAESPPIFIKACDAEGSDPDFSFKVPRISHKPKRIRRPRKPKRIPGVAFADVISIDPVTENLGYARCHICGAEVDITLYRSIIKCTPPLPFRLQYDLCRAHEAKAANDEWLKRGYPTIDWSALKDRLLQQKHFVQKITQSNEQSFFEGSMEAKIKSHSVIRSRYHTLGYYGPKASDIL